MKVTVKEKSAEKEYPWIGINQNKYIVLFDKPNSGICLSQYDNSALNVGNYSHCWTESEYKPFTGEITLSNS